MNMFFRQHFKLSRNSLRACVCARACTQCTFSCVRACPVDVLSPLIIKYTVIALDGVRERGGGTEKGKWRERW